MQRRDLHRQRGRRRNHRLIGAVRTEEAARAGSSGFLDEPPPFAPLLREAAPDLLREARDVVAKWAALRLLRPWTVPASALADGDWARFPLELAGVRVETNRRPCPRSAALVDRLGEYTTLGSAAFYLLGPRSHVRPHCGRGSTSGFLRAHLGLICPPSCVLRVGAETRRWETGELLVFDDGFEHEAWNGSDATRCVLHLDFADPTRPGPEIAERLRTMRDEAFADLLRTRPIVLAADLAAPEDLRAAFDARREWTQREVAGRAALRAGAEQLSHHGLFL